MNDFDPSLDEIVSAYVDGVATPDERARVESDPTLVERAATFRRLQAALATAPTGDDTELRNTLIARALAATAVSGATVHTLRSRRSATLGPIAAAAAIIALFFGLGTWLVASQDNAGDQATSAATSPANADALDAKGQLESSTAGAPTQAGSATTTGTAKTAPVYLGGFPDDTSLRQALVAERDGSRSNAPTTAPPLRASADVSVCPSTDLAGASIYSADLRERRVTIVVRGTQAEVIDDATCTRTTLDLTDR